MYVADFEAKGTLVSSDELCLTTRFVQRSGHLRSLPFDVNPGGAVTKVRSEQYRICCMAIRFAR